MLALIFQAVSLASLLRIDANVCEGPSCGEPVATAALLQRRQAAPNTGLLSLKKESVAGKSLPSSLAGDDEETNDDEAAPNTTANATGLLSLKKESVAGKSLPSSLAGDDEETNDDEAAPNTTANATGLLSLKKESVAGKSLPSSLAGDDEAAAGSAACSVADNVIPSIGSDFAAWVTAVRDCKAQNPMATWSSTDGAKGCGWTKEDGTAATPSSPGQPCKINWDDSGIGYSDGMCVAAASQNECWALLNVAHQPSEYLTES